MDVFSACLPALNVTNFPSIAFARVRRCEIDPLLIGLSLDPIRKSARRPIIGTIVKWREGLPKRRPNRNGPRRPRRPQIIRVPRQRSPRS